MPLLQRILAICPVCNVGHVAFGKIGCVRRCCTAKCSNCGQVFYSDLSYSTYLLLMIYIHVILAMTGIPMVFALAGGAWFVAMMALTVFFLFVIPPAMVLHARNMQVRNSKDVVEKGRDA